MRQRCLALAPFLALAIVIATIAVYIYEGAGDSGNSAKAELKPFKVKDRQGTTQTINPASDYRDNVVVVNFFASWCRPCKAEHPQLKTLGRQDDVVMLGINHRMDPEMDKFLKNHGNPYDRIVRDTEGEASMTFALSGLPETFVINPQGELIYHKAGPITDKLLKDAILPKIRQASGKGQ
jgi:DsbE subfamily thiol:disulfide oxidoreductase